MNCRIRLRIRCDAIRMADVRLRVWATHRLARKDDLDLPTPTVRAHFVSGAPQTSLNIFFSL